MPARPEAAERGSAAGRVAGCFRLPSSSGCVRPSLAREAVAVPVEVVDVGADDLDGTGVPRPVAAAAGAVDVARHRDAPGVGRVTAVLLVGSAVRDGSAAAERGDE